MYDTCNRYIKSVVVALLECFMCQVYTFWLSIVVQKSLVIIRLLL